MSNYCYYRTCRDYRVQHYPYLRAGRRGKFYAGRRATLRRRFFFFLSRHDDIITFRHLSSPLSHPPSAHPLPPHQDDGRVRRRRVALRHRNLLRRLLYDGDVPAAGRGSHDDALHGPATSHHSGGGPFRNIAHTPSAARCFSIYFFIPRHPSRAFSLWTCVEPPPPLFSLWPRARARVCRRVLCLTVPPATRRKQWRLVDDYRSRMRGRDDVWFLRYVSVTCCTAGCDESLQSFFGCHYFDRCILVNRSIITSEFWKKKNIMNICPRDNFKCSRRRTSSELSTSVKSERKSPGYPDWQRNTRFSPRAPIEKFSSLIVVFSFENVL